MIVKPVKSSTSNKTCNDPSKKELIMFSNSLKIQNYALNSITAKNAYPKPANKRLKYYSNYKRHINKKSIQTQNAQLLQKQFKEFKDTDFKKANSMSPKKDWFRAVVKNCQKPNSNSELSLNQNQIANYKPYHFKLRSNSTLLNSKQQIQHLTSLNQRVQSQQTKQELKNQMQAYLNDSSIQQFSEKYLHQASPIEKTNEDWNQFKFTGNKSFKNVIIKEIYSHSNNNASLKRSMKKTKRVLVSPNQSRLKKHMFNRNSVSANSQTHNLNTIQKHTGRSTSKTSKRYVNTKQMYSQGVKKINPYTKREYLHIKQKQELQQMRSNQKFIQTSYSSNIIKSFEIKPISTQNPLTSIKYDDKNGLKSNHIRQQFRRFNSRTFNITQNSNRSPSKSKGVNNNVNKKKNDIEGWVDQQQTDSYDNVGFNFNL